MEEALFGGLPSTTHGCGINATTTGNLAERTNSAHGDVATILPEPAHPDYATACDSVSSVSTSSVVASDAILTVNQPADYHNINFRFAQPSRLAGTTSSDLTDDLPDHATLGNSVRSIWLPSKEGILALLDDYLQGQHLFLGIIDPLATRQLIDQVYSQLPRRKGFRLSHVALLLSIAATSAFFWEKEDARLKYSFSSAFDAANWSVFWRNSAWDVLDQLRRDVTGSLEELQATCILAQLISQIEGCPSRYRRLQGNAITIAREISLHVIDAPNAFLPWDKHPDDGNDINNYQACDTEAVREIKRRVWWHLAGTDWLLSVMGGPLYKAYTINPLHMNVRYPRNINDDGLQNLTPWPKDSPRDWPDTATEPPTAFTYSILRLRVAEICRKIVDTLQPIAYSRHGPGEGIEHLPYGEILRISKFFDEALASFPPSYHLGAPIPPGAPPDLDLQRKVLLLYFHARRARIFRPFLRSSAAANTRYGRDGTRHAELPYEHFAGLCRDSARTVLAIASSLVSPDRAGANSTTGSSRRQATKPKIVHRSGLVLMHLFMACVILATDPTLSPNNPVATADVANRRRELAEGCYLLQMAGQKSLMASGLMDSLTVVLNRHKLRVFCNKGAPDCETQGPQGSSATEQGEAVMGSEPHLSTPATTQPYFSGAPSPSPHREQSEDTAPSQVASSGSFIAGINELWGIDQIEARVLAQHAQNRKQRSGASADTSVQSHNTPQTSPYETAQNNQIPSPAATELLPLDGLWKDLVDAAYSSSMEAFGGQNSAFDSCQVATGNGSIEDGIQWDHLFADLDYFVGPS